MNTKTRITGIILLFTGTLLTGVIFSSLIRNYGKDFFLSATTQKTVLPQDQLILKWWDAVRKGKKDLALALASEIVPESNEYSLPETGYRLLFESESLPTGLLAGPFKDEDFKRWQKIARLQKIVESADGQKELLWAMHENFEDAAEIAFQAHYKIALLGIFEEKGRILKEYLYMEKDGKSLTIDMLALKNWNGTDNISENDITNGGKFKVLGICRLPWQDFRKNNILLFQRVQSLRNLILADFPLSPIERLNQLREHHQPEFSIYDIKKP